MTDQKPKHYKRFIFRGKAAVFIDWANVHGWEKQSFVFFTGDGDYEPLYKMLIGLRKQVMVIYTKGHLGREIWAIKKGLFKAQLKNLMDL